MKLLALVESPDHVCCRYRIRAFEPALNQAGCSLEYSGLNGDSLLRGLRLGNASQFDAVILQRKLLPGWQLGVLRRASRHLAFDFDDAIGFRDSYDRRGLESRWRARRFARTVSTVDTIIAGNDFLADCALRAGAKVERVHVIPTCVEPARYPVARHETTSEFVDLVWIGSGSTLQGLEESRPIWERLAQSNPKLRLRVICDRFPQSFPLPIVPVAWSQASEADEIAAGQIGVSWLPDDLWSRGKCGLKILQYQAAGLPVVANPVGSHCEMVQKGETGFLASSPDEWCDAVGRLAGDARLRRSMGEFARNRVESDYSITAWAQTFITSVTGNSRHAGAGSWKIDRQRTSAPASGPTPHALKSKSLRTLNQIGDR